MEDKFLTRNPIGSALKPRTARIIESSHDRAVQIPVSKANITYLVSQTAIILHNPKKAHGDCVIDPYKYPAIQNINLHSMTMSQKTYPYIVTTFNTIRLKAYKVSAAAANFMYRIVVVSTAAADPVAGDTLHWGLDEMGKVVGFVSKALVEDLD
ncbi:MAG: hypothetical protein Q9218_008092 [Villophora microphyllina]